MSRVQLDRQHDEVIAHRRQTREAQLAAVQQGVAAFNRRREQDRIQRERTN